jgi:HlyD family secretion protein
MRKLIAGLVVLGLAAVAIFAVTRRGGAETNSYRFVDVDEGPIEAVVAATGALSAVQTVQVGTQVSGQITDIYVDFNDQVKRGQLIARLDTTLLVQAVQSQEANLERVQAELSRNEWEYERAAELFKSQGVTESEYKTAEYNLAASKSNLASTQVNLEQARRNLGYSRIYAPIDGVVVERNVEPGQTVAASMSTPQLFLIANDLSQMEILASVDESDIGQIHEGQEARFTVQAYPDESFSGTVRQVRLQSSVQENVVNYTVVVSVRNDDGRLLPGMTATVDFIIERVENVMRVPNAALRFRPTQAMMTEWQERMQAQREQMAAGRAAAGASDSTAAAGEGRPARGDFANMSEEERQAMRERFAQGGGVGGPGRGGFGGAGGQGNQLWYVDADGLLQVARVQAGVTDGQYTEVSGRGIEPGMQVIAGVVVSATEAAPTNPFQPQQQNRGFGPRGF